MQQPTDAIAEQVQRQLQLALAATADQARRDSAQHAHALNAQPEWAALFARRRVAIAIDCDQAGRQAATRIARDLDVAEAIRLADVAQPQSPTQALSNAPAHWAAFAPSTAPAQAIKRAGR